MDLPGIWVDLSDWSVFNHKITLERTLRLNKLPLQPFICLVHTNKIRELEKERQRSSSQHPQNV